MWPTNKRNKQHDNKEHRHTHTHTHRQPTTTRTTKAGRPWASRPPHDDQDRPPYGGEPLSKGGPGLTAQRRSSHTEPDRLEHPKPSTTNERNERTNPRTHTHDNPTRQTHKQTTPHRQQQDTAPVCRTPPQIAEALYAAGKRKCNAKGSPLDFEPSARIALLTARDPCVDLIFVRSFGGGGAARIAGARGANRRRRDGSFGVYPNGRARGANGTTTRERE